MEQFGIQNYYGDWREMIDSERPDFVDIITPPETHSEMCAYAAERGRDHHLPENRWRRPMRRASRSSRRPRPPGFDSWSTKTGAGSPGYRKIKEIQEAGTIGEFTHLNFLMRMGDGWGENAYIPRQPFFRDYPRLLVYETAVHFIDTFRFLFGEVTEVYANLRRLNPVIKGEETGQLLFKFDSGATALLDANRYNEVEVGDAALHVRAVCGSTPWAGTSPWTRAPTSGSSGWARTPATLPMSTR